MPWYRVYADHGPGHQSHTESYIYRNKPLTKEERESEWEQLVYDRHLNDAIGKVDLVKRVPEHILAEKIESARSLAKYYKWMLKVYATTESCPTIAVRHERSEWKDGKLVREFQKARLLNKPEVCAEGTSRKAAVNALFRILRKSGPVTRSRFNVIVR